ncbi:hypothetical protein [Maribacter sp. R86514]|uniref:hypothetical protein n=1 Tax=Maribacter sp. R86514 TaxID=3093854 RepID=UPI0037CAC3FA
MKQLYFLCILLGTVVQSCGQVKTDENQTIASSYGYVLTERQFDTYLKFLEQQTGEESTLDTQIALKAQLKEAFLSNPETIAQELATLENMLGAPKIDKDDKTLFSMAEGHKIVRDLLGSDIGEMQFDTDAANSFRNYMTNTVLTTSSNNYNTSYNSSDYSSSQGQIQFCANGTFVEVLSGHLSIDTEGMDATSSGSSAMPGYWEAAALPNGMFIIIMYSTHARMLEDSPNGILPFVVAKHGIDFVQLPSGDLYRRTPNQYCN